MDQFRELKEQLEYMVHNIISIDYDLIDNNIVLFRIDLDNNENETLRKLNFKIIDELVSEYNVQDKKIKVNTMEPLIVRCGFILTTPKIELRRNEYEDYIYS